ncbi:MAG: hypothetical protein R3F62_15895 [Planctomycetota bacterium]
MRLLLLACVAFPLIAQAQDNPIAGLILRATRSGNPSLSFLEGLGQLEATEVGRDELENVLYTLDAQGIVVPEALGGVLADLERISLGEFAESHQTGETRSREVSFVFSEAPAPIDVVRGWVHLEEEVSFVLAENADGTTQLRSFEGFKVGRSQTGIALAPKYVVFDTQSENPVARVKVPFVAEMEVSLGTRQEPEGSDGLASSLADAGEAEEPEPAPEPSPVAPVGSGPEQPPISSEQPPIASTEPPAAEQPIVPRDETPEPPAELEPEEVQAPDLTIPGDPVVSLPPDVLAQEDQLAALIEHASRDEQPLLTLIAGLRELDAETLSGAEVDQALAAAAARGVEVPSSLTQLLSGIDTIELGRQGHASERQQREKGKLRRRRVEITYAETPAEIDLSREWDHLEDEQVTLHLADTVVFNFMDYVNGSTRVWPIVGIKADRERTRYRDEHVNVFSLRYEPQDGGGVARLRAGLLLYPIEVPLGPSAAPTPGLVGGLLDD